MSIIDDIIEYANKNTKYGKCIVILRKQFVKCNLSGSKDHIVYVEKYIISTYMTEKDIQQIIKNYNNLHNDNSHTKLEKLLFEYGYTCKIIASDKTLKWISPTYYIFIQRIVSKL